MADIFISYKKIDRDRIQPLIAGLEARGFTVWWDYEIEAGEQWFERIIREIEIARCVIGVWTKNSVSHSGGFVPNEQGLHYVRMEHKEALKPKSRLLPVVLDPGRIAIEFAHLQSVDLSDWSGAPGHDGWRQLINSVETLATPDWVHARYSERDARLEAAVERAREAQKLATARQSAISAASAREAQAQQALEDALAAAAEERQAFDATVVAARAAAKQAEDAAADAAVAVLRADARTSEAERKFYAVVQNASKIQRDADAPRTTGSKDSVIRRSGGAFYVLIFLVSSIVIEQFAWDKKLRLQEERVQSQNERIYFPLSRFSNIVELQRKCEAALLMEVTNLRRTDQYEQEYELGMVSSLVQGPGFSLVPAWTFPNTEDFRGCDSTTRTFLRESDLHQAEINKKFAQKRAAEDKEYPTRKK